MLDRGRGVLPGVERLCGATSPADRALDGGAAARQRADGANRTVRAAGWHDSATHRQRTDQ